VNGATGIWKYYFFAGIPREYEDGTDIELINDMGSGKGSDSIHSCFCMVVVKADDGERTEWMKTVGWMHLDGDEAAKVRILKKIGSLLHWSEKGVKKLIV
jgi:hypothetical protein